MLILSPEEEEKEIQIQRDSSAGLEPAGLLVII